MLSKMEMNVLLSGDRFRRQEEYWLGKLQGELALPALLTDIKRPEAEPAPAGEIKITIPEALSQKLMKISKKNDLSLYLILLTGLKCLVYRYTSDRDIVIASPVLVRNATQETLNAMVLVRDEIDGDMTFKDCLMKVRQTVLEAYENQDYPLEKVLERLSIPKGKGGFNIFNIACLLKNIHHEKAVEEGKSKLVFSFERHEEHIDGHITYNQDTFPGYLMEGLSGHLVNILDEAADDVNTKLKDIRLLSREEEKRLLVDFNATAAGYPLKKTICQLFEEQVERTPGSTALVLDNHELTYRELNEKANQLARVLREKGVKPDSITGIISERSFEMVIGFLAVLKAGGAYLPIDPSYPAERIAYMLEDSEAKILLTQNTVDRGQLTEDSNKSIEVILLDDEGLYVGDSSNLENINTPGDLVYVIYTSGSTGRPKGVMVTQQGLVNYIWWAQKVYLKGEKLDFPLYSSISFDLTVTSIFTPLITGNRIVIYNGPSIEKVIKDNRTGIVKLTPTHLKLLEEMDLKESGIKKLIVGGEDLKTELAKKICDSFAHGVEIYNEYGPTETVVGCMIHQYDPERDVRSSVPIGVPADNVQIYLLDEYLNPVPAGAVGEMYISGDGVARGYLNRPELTAEKFIPNPFNNCQLSTVNCQLLYRTGDLARMMADGRMEFLGRADHQVKIRGYRIETGEIETQLMKHPAVDEAAVTVIEEGGESSLCAYIVYRYDVTVAELKEHISKELPEYMVPSCFVRLEAMPMTANGKLDRKGLPKPGPGISTGTEYEVPCNETEERLAALWQDLLNMERVGAKDNFFELGGHSLKAMMLGSRINKEFGVDIQPGDIFEAPVLRELAGQIRDRRKKIYLRIEPVEEKEFYEVSSAQKRLFILEQFGGIGTGYNVPVVVAMSGGISKEKLKELFVKLICRHEAFRTSFEMMDGRPVQRIHREVDFDMEYMEASEEEVPGLIKSFIRPFDLGRAPLFRAKLVKVADDRHILMLDMHHIITDGVSMSILVKEMGLLHRGAELPELRVQYKDFAEWQNRLMANGVLKEQEDHWLKVFQGEIPVLNLPADYPRPAVQSFEGSGLSFRLGEELAVQLKAFALERNATLYMVLLAAYNLMLSKYSRQEDIVVGSAVMGRTHADLENVIGIFINMLAMKNKPIGDMTFGEFLDTVKKNALDAYKNQDYQFEELVDRLNVPRDMGRNPLFDVTFTLQNIDMHGEEFGGMGMESYKFEAPVAKYDLYLAATDTGSDILFNFEYCKKLFHEETVKRMAGHLINILAEIIKAPEKRLADINMLSEDETRQIIIDFNDTRAEYPADKTIRRLFEEQVERTPGSTALVLDNHELTYRELNEKANQLARVLREKGVKPDSITGIISERSFEMVIGFLAVLKAGGAYLPIDPSYPADRIAYMLEDSGAKILLTQNTVDRGQLTEGSNKSIEVILLDDEGLYVGDSSNLENINTPGDLAYVIYTSGSTGRPKGVMVTQQGLVNYIWWAQKVYLKGEKLDFPLYSSISFDLTVTSIFTPLITGNRIVIYNGPSIEKVIKDNRTGIVKLTPTHLKLLEEMDLKESGIKKLIVGGEDLKTDLAKKIYDSFAHGVEIYNEYGPTETVVGCMIHLYDPGKDVRSSVPIGVPADNVQIYLLDEHLKPVPAGAVGEMYISGDGVARGYLNRPELTAERFIPNPFNNCQLSTVNCQLLYRTGDLARMMEDGRMEFLGRADHQVKIRGYRIETGEIEMQLMKHPAVDEAAVTVIEEGGESSLCAYIVYRYDVAVTELKEHISKELPEYMVPSCFVRLEAMPMTANGKLDRKALPKPGPGISTGAEYEAPCNETEERLAALWQDLLNMERVGARDNFFELGGHSLKAMMLGSRINREFGVDIQPRDIFEAPVLRALAERIREGERGKYLRIEPVEEKEFYEVSSAQKRLFIIEQFGGVGIGYNVPAAVTINGDISRERLEELFLKLIHRHEAFRTSFEMMDNRPVQRIHREVEFDMEYAEASGKEVSECIKSFIRPFDLGRAPLFRAGLVKVAENKHILMIDMHHIITDGVSMGILMKEMALLHQGEELPELRIQYKDFSEWQNRLIGGGAVKEQEEYWLKVFEGEIPVLNLPFDYPRPAAQSFEGNVISFRMSEELAARLKAFTLERNATLYMVLLAAYSLLLSKYSGQEDIVVGTVVAGRTHADLENIIGMFINMLAMRNKPMGHITFDEFLDTVKTNALNAYKNQDYQFEELIDRLRVPRDMSRSPLFDVAFTVQNMDMSGKELGSMGMESYKSEGVMSKYDLSLVAADTGSNILFSFEYCTKLFSKETIERMASHFINILDEILKAPGKRLADIPMLSEEETRQITIGFNNTSVEYPEDKTVHQLFERQAAETPGNIAAIFKHRRMTYRELNEKANRLAHLLRKKGVKPGSIAAVTVNRGFDMLTGILGILKAGGAYLPIDLEYPRERIRYMLEDSGAGILLVSQKSAVMLPEGAPIALIPLDDEALYVESGSNPENINVPQDPAYVIYTSGSTGKPKGVIIEHRSVNNFIQGITDIIDFSPGKTILALTTISFDIFVLETLLPLAKGLTVVIADEETQRESRLLEELIVKNSVDMLQMTPSRLQLLMKGASLSCLKHLKEIMVGGEAFPQSLLGDLSEATEARIYNMYGPTETTVWSAVKNLNGAREITIGRPIANTRIYILDRDGHVLPPGVAGELCIGGDGLARGYLNRPELTAERFVPDPFAPIAYSPLPITPRMYKTGDLAKWLPDGNIECLGRIDHQVKIRGYRIEPDEIEFHLSTHQRIKEVVVVAIEDKSGGKSLCAYLVCDGEPTVMELREHLLKVLPDYMVPSYFVQLERMPLTPSGKVDRKALPEPGGSINASVEYAAPRDNAELKLADIWQGVLGVERVGLDDNFFELGGQSLKAAVLTTRIYEEFNVRLPMQEVFVGATVREQAAYIRKMAGNSHRTDNTAPDADVLPVTADKRLSTEYYYLDDGNMDPFVGMLECYEAILYFILKNKTGISNPCELFLRDICFNITENSDGIITDIEFLDHSNNTDVFKIKKHSGKGEKDLSRIEALLDQGDLVMIKTFSERLPFFRWYIGMDASEDLIQFGHVFLAAYHDHKNLYYVEAPWNIHPDNFIPYNPNKSIGIIGKEELKPAFNALMNYETVKIKESALPGTKKAVKVIKNTLRRSTASYGKKAEKRGGSKILYGRQALDKFVEVCGKEFLHLNCDVASGKRTFFIVVALKFWGIINRRKVLYQSLLKYKSQWDQDCINELLNVLNDLIKAWTDTFYFLDNKFKKQKYLLDLESQKYFIHLASLEEKLVDLFQKL